MPIGAEMNVCVSDSRCMGESLDGGLPVYTGHMQDYGCVCVCVCPQVYAISTGCGLTEL